MAGEKLLRFSALDFTLGYVGFTFLVLGLFALPIGYAWRHNIEQTRAAIVTEDAQGLADLFKARGADTLAAAIQSRVIQQKTGQSILLLTDASFTPIAGNLPEWPPELPDGDGLYKLKLREPGGVIRAHLVRLRLEGGYNLLVGRDTARFGTLETFFWSALVLAMLMALTLGVTGGLLVRRLLLSEVHRINETASAVVQGELSRRVPVSGGTSELEMLAQTVNRMLDQIEQLLNGVRNVSNAIAHDLRTPLTELRARLEMLLVTRPSADDAMLEIESAVGDVDRVMGIFNALLRLAQIETGARRAAFVELDLADVARDAVDFYQPVAEVSGIALSCKCGSEIIAGDALLLAQALGNLIDNAVKYTQKGGAITVEVARCADRVCLSVADNGPGIAPEERSKVSERFYRGDRSRGTPGVGLGLSLVSAIAALHRGRLELADNSPGLRAALVLPI